MEKWTKIRIDKIILKNLVTANMVFVAYIGTLGFYLLFLHILDTDMKIYEIGLLAGATGGIWGYAMTNLFDFRQKIHKMTGKKFYAPSFYYQLRRINIVMIIVLPIVGAILHTILGNLNL